MLLLLVPRPALADFAAVCQPNPFKGSVKRVVLSEANADIESGAATRPLHVRHVTDVTSDGRTVTEVSTDHLEDSPPDVRASRFTTIRQYDSARRMTSEILKVGVTTFTTTLCEYDSQNRLARVTVQSQNPMHNRTLTYMYGPSWRSEQLVTSAVSILTTVTLDEKGRPLVEKRQDQLQHVQLGGRDYRYLPEGVEECIRQSDGNRPCRLSIRDAHGNEVEGRSDKGITRVLYEYDSAGNWTKRITSYPGLPTYGVWRKITYW